MTTIVFVFVAILLILIIAGPIGWILGRIRRLLWIKTARYKHQKDSLVVAQYAPPNDLSAAEIAYLYDRTFGEQELLASLFSLEQHGKLRLEKVKSTDTANFKVVPLSKGTEKDLSSFNQELILSIRAMQHQDWLSIKKDNNLWENGFERYLERDLQAKDLILLPDDLHRQKIITLFIGVLLAFLATFGSFWVNGESLDIRSENQFEVLGGQIYTFVLLVLMAIETALLYAALRFATAMFCRGSNTVQGTALLSKLWPEIEGYRQYVQQVELDNVVFDNENSQQSTIQTVLPYAIALNLTTRWENRFTG